MSRILFFLLLGVVSLSSLFPQMNSVLDQQSSQYVDLTVIQAEAKAEEAELIFRFRVKPPYHINSGSPLIEGLIPTTVAVGGGLEIVMTAYPPDEILDISGYRTTVYFKGPHDLRLTLKKNGETGQNSVTDYAFRYQACKDDQCYAPEEITGRIDITWEKSNNRLPLLGLLGMAAFAFLGGLILNFTPCVLPILSLKLISLSAMKQSGESKDSKNNKRRFAAFHISGVLLFFLIMAVAVAVLKTGGEEIGWGFQFQNPYYILFITLVLTVVSINLWGGFEIPFSYQTGFFPKERGENLKNFATGFLSVILATPCTVPFLGAAAAYSFSRGISEIFLLHGFTALGFSFPYALIFIGVDISRLIPKVRSLERVIKKILGFLIALTVIWLIDIYWSITGEGLFLLFTLWATGLGLWVYGEFQKKNLSHKWELGFWVIAVILWVMVIMRSPVVNQIESDPSENITAAPLETDSVIPWVNFDKDLLRNYRAQGKPVYVHFTADWCLNCKVNEKLVIENKTVLSLFQRHEVVMMKADWTKSNDDIFGEIKNLGRAGIPLDVIYRGDKQVVLSTILTVGEIESVLAELFEEKASG